MLTSLSTSLKAAFNRSNPNSLASMLASVRFGDVLRRENVQVRSAALSVDPYGPASNTTLVLPDDAKCATVLAGYARAGTATCGQLIPQIPGAGVGTTLFCAPSVNGNILFHAADAWTSVDVLYVPQHVSVIEVTLAVPASGILVLPVGIGSACELYEAQRTDTLSTKLVPTTPAASNATNGTVCFNLAKTDVLFSTNGDAVVSARLKLGVADSVDINALLEAVSAFI